MQLKAPSGAFFIMGPLQLTTDALNERRLLFGSDQRSRAAKPSNRAVIAPFTINNSNPNWYC